ncbi:MAG: class I tRNA ligase family protein, partial [Anaerolineae bacterium]|nr:class I tRNA ligase family protein [Anaerolineae bacterium]
ILDIDQSLISNLQLPDRWILSRLNRLIQSVDRLFEAYQYGEAGRQIHDFLWGEYCDWYIEASKVRLYGPATGTGHGEAAERDVPRAVLLHVLERALRLLHPFMPFVTEAIWQALPDEVREGEALMMARWPEQDIALLSGEAEERMGLAMELVRGIRNRRAEYDVTPGKRIPALIAAGDAAVWLEEQRAVLCALAKLDSDQLSIQPAIEPPDQAATVVVGDVACYLPLAGLVDLDAERERLSKSLTEIEGRIVRSEALLAGEFAQRAPEQVVQRERDKLADLQARQAKLTEQLSTLG